MNYIVYGRILLGFLTSILANYCHEKTLSIWDVITTHFPKLHAFIEIIQMNCTGGRDPKRPRLSKDDTPTQDCDEIDRQDRDKTPTQDSYTKSEQAGKAPKHESEQAGKAPKHESEQASDAPEGGLQELIEEIREIIREKKESLIAEKEEIEKLSAEEMKQFMESFEKDFDAQEKGPAQKEYDSQQDERLKKIRDTLDEKCPEEAFSKLDKLRAKQEWLFETKQDEASDAVESLVRYAKNHITGSEVQGKALKAQKEIDAWINMPEGKEKEEVGEDIANRIETAKGQLDHTNFIDKQSRKETQMHTKKMETQADKARANVHEAKKHIMDVLGIENKQDLYKLMAEEQFRENPDIPCTEDQLAKALAATWLDESDSESDSESSKSDLNKSKSVDQPSDTPPYKPTYSGKGKKRVYDSDFPINEGSSSKRNSSNESLEFISYKSPGYDLFNFYLSSFNLPDYDLSDYDMDYDIINEYSYSPVCIIICIFLLKLLHFSRIKLSYFIITVIFFFILLFLLLMFI